MQENNLFEYAVIRVVPRVEREEFLNVGVILFCKKKKYLKVLYRIDEARIYSLCSGIDLEEYKAHLFAFNAIALGGKGSGPIGELDVAERFRWLTATRSTMLQSSKVHPGLSLDLDKTLERLYEEMVL